jgi:hypothetical protein
MDWHMATRKAYLFAQSLGKVFAPRLDQRFHSGFSTRQRAGLDYLAEGFHDVSSFSVLTVAG